MVPVLVAQDDGLMLTLQASGWMEEGVKKEGKKEVTWPHLASREAGDVTLILDDENPQVLSLRKNGSTEAGTASGLVNSSTLCRLCLTFLLHQGLLMRCLITIWFSSLCGQSVLAAGRYVIRELHMQRPWDLRVQIIFSPCAADPHRSLLRLLPACALCVHLSASAAVLRFCICSFLFTLSE